jgi:nicotinamide mononucleotide (NMN) deamidase PncC
MSVGNVDLVRQIHASGRHLVVAVTGGGSLAISRLLTVPGASHSVLEALVPYAEPALARFLGGQPDQFCSPSTARAMAMAAYRRAVDLAEPSATVVGVACTAGLATERPKHGPHRLHVAAQSRSTTRLVSLELEKGSRTRAQEEELVADVLLNLIAECCGLADRLPLALTETEQLQPAGIEAPVAWQALLAGESDRLRVSPFAEPTTPPKILFPGAFHPLHDGHRRMAAVATELLKAPVDFEITIVNADKPALDYLEIDTRLRQFAPDQSLWLSRAATFVEKSRLFPRVTFLVGADTIERIAAVRFYGDDPRALDQAMKTLDDQGCNFLVFGRSHDGGFRTLGEMVLPPALAKLCRGVPATLFRDDISSTALRRRLDPYER